jgi:tripartite-type tricarboxylate transporter receptor subunit TctC
MNRNLSPAAVATMLAAALFAPFAAAQTYPNKPIRIIVGAVPGGTSDILARLIGARLQAAWGQQVLVDSRPGASGLIGTELTSRAAPDGYTLMLLDLSVLITAPIALKSKVDPLKELSPVITISYSPHLLCVHPSVPVSNVAQLVALAKKNPGRLNYASSGPASAPHFAGVLFAQRMGIDWAYIPAKGGAQSILHVATGESDVLFNGMLATFPHVTSGRLKLLAVSGGKRSPAAPNVPTVAESLPGFLTGSWQGIVAPQNTPADLINRLHGEIRRILDLPDSREKLAAQGTEVLATPPAEMGAFMIEQRERWTPIVRVSIEKARQ